MKKTYVTTMPDNVGAFLRASRRIAALGINITRVSYDKAVDLHTLFIELDADEDKLRIADAQLAELGYVNSPATRRGIVLLEFKLRDEPGSVTTVLELMPAIISTYPTSVRTRTAAVISDSAWAC